MPQNKNSEKNEWYKPPFYHLERHMFSPYWESLALTDVNIIWPQINLLTVEFVLLQLLTLVWCWKYRKNNNMENPILSIHTTHGCKILTRWSEEMSFLTQQVSMNQKTISFDWPIAVIVSINLSAFLRNEYTNYPVFRKFHTQWIIDPF